MTENNTYNVNTDRDAGGTYPPELTCAVVRDLLPLYHDKAVSIETSDAVEAHINKCTECAQELKKLDEELPLNDDIPDTVKSFKNMVKKKRKKSFVFSFLWFLAGALVIIIAALIFFKATKFVVRDAMLVPWNESCIEDLSVHHAALPDPSYYNKTADNMYLLLYAPPGDMTVTHNNGVLEMTFKHPLWNPDLFADGQYFDMFTVPVQEGDRELRINGRHICDIGEPETPEQLPDYIKAYNNSRFKGRGFDFIPPDEEHTEFIIRYWPEEGKCIEWDVDGNVLTDTTGGDRSFLEE